MSKKKGGEQIKRKSTAHPALRRPRPLLLLTFLPYLSCDTGFLESSSSPVDLRQPHARLSIPAALQPTQCSPCIPLRTLETRAKL
jgi:hypothetical protein